MKPMLRSGIYISYSNHDYEFALQLSRDLMRTGYAVLLDRLHHSHVKADAPHDFYAMADAAVVIFSAYYDAAPYCQTELQQLLQQDIPLYVLVIDPLYQLPQRYNQKIQLDVSEWRDGKAYEDILSALQGGLSTAAIHLTPEQLYLIEQLLALEHQHLAKLTARIRRHTDRSERTRPRCYSLQAWLTQGNYRLIKADGEEVRISDVVEQVTTHPRLLISGERGTGKSSLLNSLAHYLTDARLMDKHLPLPLLINLDKWDARTPFAQFLASLWPSDGDFDVFLQRGGIMLLIDGAHRLSRGDRRLRLLYDWLASDAALPAILTAHRQNPFRRLPALPELRVETLSSGQLTPLAQAITGNQEIVDTLSALPEMRLDEFVHIALDVVLSEQSQVTPIDTVYERAFTHYWKLTRFSGAKYHTQKTVKVRLFALAVLLVDEHRQHTFDATLALTVLGDQLMLQQLIQLGILEHVGNQLRFASSQLQTYLALAGLMQEGIYTRLSYPQFDEDGQWLSEPWDLLLLKLPRFFSSPTRTDLAHTVMDVDAYLALQILLADSDPDRYLLSKVLHRIFSTDRHEFWSANAMTTVIKPHSNVSELSAALYNLIRWIDAVALERLITFVQANYRAARGIRGRLLEQDFEFPEQFHEAMSDYPVDILTLSIVRLLGDTKSKIRRSAVRAVGFFEDEISKPLFIWLLQQPDETLYRGAMDSLLHTASHLHDEVLLSAALQVQDEAQAMLLYDDIIESERRLSFSLLKLFDEAGLASADNINLIAALDELTVVGVSVYQIERLSLGTSTVRELEDTGNGMINRLLAILDKHMADFSNFASFDAFVNDAMSSMNAVQQQKSRQVDQLKDRFKAMSTSATSIPGTDDVPQELIERLHHEDWLMRRNAIYQLKDYEPSKTIGFLLAALRDRDHGVQVAAIQTLPDPNHYSDVREALLEHLDDSDDYHVVDAVTARLRELGTTIEAALQNRLQQRISIETLAAVLDLLAVGEMDTSADLLATCLDDDRQAWLGERTIAEIAHDSLVAMGTPYALSLLDNSGSAVSAQVVEPLTVMDAEEPINHLYTLLDELRNGDWDQSQAAAKVLRQYAANLAHNHVQEDVDILMSAIDDTNWVVRWAIVEALAWLKNVETIPAIIRRLEDEYWVVRVAALRALIEMHAATVVPQIAPRLSDDQSSVREAAAEAIGVLGSKSDAAYLAVAMQDNDDFVRLAAAKALIALGGKDAVKLLLTARHDSYTHLRWHVAQYLTGLKHKGLLSTYTSMLKDITKPSWEERSISMMAEDAIMALNTAESRAVMARWETVKKRYR